MGIKFFEDRKYFKLDARDTSYIIAIVDDEKFWGMYISGKEFPMNLWILNHFYALMNTLMSRLKTTGKECLS